MDLSIATLIVDDSESMRKMIRKALADFGLKNHLEAGSGKEALDIMAARDVGLVISDWNMPKGNGLEFLKAIRASKRHENLPFIMLTSEAGAESYKIAMDHGATDYISKPFTKEQLVTKVKSIIAWSG